MAQTPLELPVKVTVDPDLLRGLREIRDGINTLLSAVEATQPKDALDGFIARVRSVDEVDTSTGDVPLDYLRSAFPDFPVKVGSTLPKD